MIKPVLAHDELLADIAEARNDTKTFHLWWLGQSGFLLVWKKSSLLIDPYLSDSLATQHAYGGKPHARMTEPVVDPRRLDFLDVTACTHSHPDHFDVETLRPLIEVNPAMKLVVPMAERAKAAETLGVDPEMLVGVDDGLTVKVGDFELTGIAAAHEELEQDEAGHHRYSGLMVRFGPWTIFHAGDTVLYDGLVERLKKFAIDAAILPINGRSPERGVAGNLNGTEAAQLAKVIDAWVAIPCHYDMFEFNTASPDEFVAEAARLEQPVRVLRCGERWSGEELRLK